MSMHTDRGLDVKRVYGCNGLTVQAVGFAPNAEGRFKSAIAHCESGEA